MDLFETIAARYSVRGYRPDAIDDETLTKVLEAARRAPTAANKQPFRVVVLRTRGREEEIGRIYGRPWFVQAPLVLGFIAVPGEAWRRWVAAFDPQAAREVLGLPDNVEPIAFTPLGHPDKPFASPERRPLEELVKYDRW
jgi:nitroreductase